MKKNIVQGCSIHLIDSDFEAFLNRELELQNTENFKEIYKEIVYIKKIFTWWELKIFTIAIDKKKK